MTYDIRHVLQIKSFPRQKSHARQHSPRQGKQTAATTDLQHSAHPRRAARAAATLNTQQRAPHPHSTYKIQDTNKAFRQDPMRTCTSPMCEVSSVTVQSPHIDEFIIMPSSSQQEDCFGSQVIR